MLTEHQITWARQHEWYAGAGDKPGTIRVFEHIYYVNAKRDWRGLATWVGSFKALRHWAGY